MVSGVGQLSNRFIKLAESQLPLSTIYPRFLVGAFFNAIVPNRFYATLNNPGLKDKGTKQFLEKILETRRINYLPALVTSLQFYSIRNDSFYDSLKICLSQSETVSRVALPFIDKITASIPAPLKRSEILIFAPLIIKCTQIYIAKFHPKKENPILSTLSTGADKVSRGLDFLLSLRISILSAGMSGYPFTLLIQETVMVVIEKLITPLIERKMFQYDFVDQFGIIKLIPRTLMCYSPLPHPWNQSTIFNSALNSGLENMYDTLFGSSYDLTTLKNLYRGSTEKDIYKARIDEKIDTFLERQIPVKKNAQPRFF